MKIDQQLAVAILEANQCSTQLLYELVIEESIDVIFDDLE